MVLEAKFSNQGADNPGKRQLLCVVRIVNFFFYDISGLLYCGLLICIFYFHALFMIKHDILLLLEIVIL